VRLVTLTGTGGIGKTRLALNLAASAPESLSRDGVVFVALADLHHPDQVMPAIANALRLPNGQGGDVAARVQAFLRSKRLLLVLDNFEHLLAASPVVGQLLQAAPHLTVLVTSRAPLRLPGERVIAVPPLQMAEAGATPAEVRASDAGRLFLERAAEHGAALDLDAGTAPVVAAICARLDGLPLAIELAAARLRVLTPHHLLQHLERRLPLLTRGPHSAPARHSTVRAAIAWSYESLPDAGKSCFQHVAVFSGGATLEAVLAMEGEEAQTATETIDTLDDLIDHSLIFTETGPDGERRFRMLETIREYGLEQVRPDQENVARQRQAAYLLSLSARWRALASTYVAATPYEVLRAEYANLGDVLAWTRDHDPAQFVTLVADLSQFWYASSLGRDADAWTPLALERRHLAPAFEQARLLVGQGSLLLQRGKPDAAEPLLAEGVALLWQADDPVHLSRALVLLGVPAALRGEYAVAEERMLEALSMAEDVPDPLLRMGAAGRALANLSTVVRNQPGGLERAAAYGEEGLRRFAGQPRHGIVAMTMIGLGAIARDQGDPDTALARSLDGIQLMGGHRDDRQVADALSCIASVAAGWGEPRTALLLLGAADAMRERTGTAMVWPADIDAAERCLAAAREALPERETHQALADGCKLSLAEAVALAETLAPHRAAGDATALQEPLTRREHDVLDLLMRHKTDREIAAALYLSARTVNWHMRAILGKFGVTSRRELIARVRAAGVAETVPEA
jgi:non-specific serine/threonine protein kinase